MNLAETARLCAVIGGVIPQQKFEPDTPTFWQAVLDDITLTDGLEAVKRLARRQPYIGTHDICREVSVIRRARIAALDEADQLVPNVDPDDVHAFKAEQRALMAAAAAGTLDVERYAAGGFTLTGATPRRPLAIGADEATSAADVRDAIRSLNLPRPPRTGPEKSPDPVVPRQQPASVAKVTEAERRAQLDALEARPELAEGEAS